MREIKFRLWDKIKKRFISVDDNPDLDFVINSSGVLYSIEYSFGETYVLLQTDTEISQYTGLKDKHGKKIYENDLVKMISFNEKICQVKFENGGYIFERGDYFEDLHNCEERFLEIVGNIYENPELMEE